MGNATSQLAALQVLALAALVILPYTPACAQQADAEVYVPGFSDPATDEAAKAPSTIKPADAEVFIGPDYEAESFSPEEAAKAPIFKRRIARLKDPFTLPQSRLRCVKWATGDWPWGGGWKACVGHAYQFKWMYSDLFLRVNMKKPRDIKRDVDQCLQDGAIVAALAGTADAFVSGGATALVSAKEAFLAVFIPCLTAKAGDVIIATRVDTKSRWGGWE